MIALIEPSAGKNTPPIYVLKIVLKATKPAVWRRLQVPGNANLGWLHAVLQVTMGWTNSHLHQFRIGDQVYSDPAFNLDEEAGSPPVLDERETILMDLALRKGTVLGYEYDFGDSWEHEIKVEKVLPRAPEGTAKAICLAAARACPPEDCGGVWGYANLLKVIKNPKHEEHDSIMEWLGGGFEPEAFDIEEANTYLRKLKWPRVTEGQLRKVLIARDDYHE
ncbi:MAG: plasmid pRiA4b ORF-3 family protein [Verrucomicrobia bacterium]|nr:plasmid pRiA4b ORF-3 family protein [Verrucomicrobiota bacterium]